MTLRERDKKILMVVVPLALIAGYWFLVLDPKRQEAGEAAAQLAQAQKKRDDAVALAARLEVARSRFGADYATLIRLGKAIPSDVDMASLLVQLDAAARGTDLELKSVTSGERTVLGPAAGAGAASASAPGGGSGTGASAQPAQPAASGPAAPAAAGSTQGANPAAAPAAGPSTGTPAALESVPLELSLSGGFTELADFLHRLKRFVRVADDRVLVRGRLMTIDSFALANGEGSRELEAEVKGTVYLTPKSQGVTAGASPAGPRGAPAPATAAPPPPSGGSSPQPSASALPTAPAGG